MLIRETPFYSDTEAWFILLQMLHHECGSSRKPLHNADGHSECVVCLGWAHGDGTLSLREHESRLLHSWIATFNEGSPPCSALRLPFCPRRKKPHTSGAITLGLSETTTAQFLCASLYSKPRFSCVLHTWGSAALVSCEQLYFLRHIWGWNHGQ